MIPGTAINNDTDEERMVIENNKKYQDLKFNKIGSDLYNIRGA